MSFDPTTCLRAHVLHCQVRRLTLLIYRPNGVRLATHAAQRWYVRPIDDDGSAPLSRAFDADEDAITAAIDGTWDTPPGRADRTPIRRR